ncbi:unnamed protein product [Calicophoron daubneyi]|uniref:Early endosome antigen 1 n=1 Tax=Calicophoron daubneyi TaxID=300641 RepID=A0AAV2T1V4_CALDB
MATETSGFVCPECMESFPSPDHLLQHFDSKHSKPAMENKPEPHLKGFGSILSGIKKVNPVRNSDQQSPKSEISGNDQSKLEHCVRLLDEMSSNNNSLLKKISEDSKRLCEFEAALDFILSGSPLSANFTFSDKELEKKVSQYLEDQTNRATSESIVEACKLETKQKDAEIENLKSRLAELEVCQARTDIQPSDKNTSTENLSGAGDQTELTEELLNSQKQLNSALEEVTELKAQLEALKADQSNLTKTDRITEDNSALQSELEKLRNEKSEVEKTLMLSKSQCESLQKQLKEHLETIKIEQGSEDPKTTAEFIQRSGDDDHLEELGKLSDEFKSIQTQLQQSEALRKSQLEAAENETKGIKARLEEVTQKSKDLALQSRETISKLTKQVEQLSEELNGCKAAFAEMEKEKSGLETKLGSLSASLSSREEILKSREEELLVMKNAREKEHADWEAKSNETKGIKARLEEVTQKSKDLALQSRETISKLTKQVEQLSEELNGCKAAFAEMEKEKSGLETKLGSLSASLSSREEILKSREEELLVMKNAREKEHADWEAKSAQLDEQVHAVHSEIEQLRRKNSELEEEMKHAKQALECSKAKGAQEKEDIYRQYQDVSAQLNTAKKESDSLMEKLIKAEDKSKSLQEQLDEQTNALKSLQKAILELGQENQSLQILRERIANRQWTKDDEATSCVSCHREFSISNRRHHCRHCGGIFCQQCSSYRAPTAASKDPVRVCASCYAELTGSSAS